MISEIELRSNEIYQWNDIKNKFDYPDLLLGNGFSLQFSNKFSYASLFEEFLKKCDSKHKKLFQQFDTPNFESIQKHLTYALKVNTIFGLPIDDIKRAIVQLKEGLISTIHEIHPKNALINSDKIEEIAHKLQGFGDIYTTNYDLYLYHIVMKTNDLKISDCNYKVSYQDYFWSKMPQGKYNEFRDFQEYRYKNIFYLHGALFIFKGNIYPKKLISIQDNLIDTIYENIKQGDFPVFISEGTSEEKMKGILNDMYLSFCMRKLRESESPIVVFGNTLGEFDSHILNAIKFNSRDIVYCIYCNGKTIDEVSAEKYNFKAKFKNYTKNIYFIDSSSLFK